MVTAPDRGYLRGRPDEAILAARREDYIPKERTAFPRREVTNDSRLKEPSMCLDDICVILEASLTSAGFTFKKSGKRTYKVHRINDVPYQVLPLLRDVLEPAGYTFIPVNYCRGKPPSDNNRIDFVEIV